MSVETHRVLIGAYGWKHPAWDNVFYDDDLPAEWQLGFYSNEFPVVYVPARDWLEDDCFAEWPEEVAETFRIVLELPQTVWESETQCQQVLSKAAQLGDTCLGLVLPLNDKMLQDVSLLKNVIKKVKDTATLVIDSENISVSDELKEIMADEAISLLWNGNLEETEGLNRGSLAVARVNSTGLAPAALRKIVEVSLAASTEQRVSVLCFDGEPPSLEVMRNADIILNLL